MTLHERAEQAAREIVNQCGAKTDKLPDIVDAIERVAREFAEEVLRDIMGCTEVNPDRYEAFIAAAIAEAEKEGI